MKKVLIALALAVIGFGAHAQNNKPALYNGSFEKWLSMEGYAQDPPFPLYDELDTMVNFWKTLNFLHGLPPELSTGPLTAFKDAGRTAGTNSIRLVSKPMIFNRPSADGGTDPLPLFLPGVVGNLTVIFEQTTATFGRPFKARPDSLVGYFKYAPVNGDSARFFVRVGQKLPSGTGMKVRESSITIHEAVPDWTRFSLPITYNFDGEMDTIAILCVSSAGYNFADLFKCQGQENSTLWVDDLELIYNPTSTRPSVKNDIESTIYPNPAKDQITLSLAKDIDNATVSVFDPQGRLVIKQDLMGTKNRLNVSNLGTGLYSYLVIANGVRLSSGKFMIQ